MDTSLSEPIEPTRPDRLTIDEVARLHRVSRRTIERWIADGSLPASKLPGGSVRISRADAESLPIPVVPR